MKTSLQTALWALLLLCAPLMSLAQNPCSGSLELKADPICEGTDVILGATTITIEPGTYFRLQIRDFTNNGPVKKYFGCDDPGLIDLVTGGPGDIFDWPAMGQPDCANPGTFTPYEFTCTNGMQTVYEIRIRWVPVGSSSADCNDVVFLTVNCGPQVRAFVEPDLACPGDLLTYCVQNPDPNITYTWLDENAIDPTDPIDEVGTTECTIPYEWDGLNGVYVVADNGTCQTVDYPFVYLSNACEEDWCEDNVVYNPTFEVNSTTCNNFTSGCVPLWTCSHGTPQLLSADVNPHARMRAWFDQVARGFGILGEGFITNGMHLEGHIQVRTNGEDGALLIVATNTTACTGNDIVPAIQANELLLWDLPLAGQAPGWVTIPLNQIVVNANGFFNRIRIYPVRKNQDNNTLEVRVDNVCIKRVPCTLTVDAGDGGFICAEQGFQLDATVTGGNAPFTYAWTPGGDLDDDAIEDPIFTAPSPGSYDLTLTVTDAHGCTATDMVNYYAKPCGERSALPYAESVFRLYPNPARDALTLNYQLAEDATLYLFDMTGRKVLSQSLSTADSHQRLTLDGLTPGIYLAQVRGGDKLYYQEKLVVND